MILDWLQYTGDITVGGALIMGFIGWITAYFLRAFFRACHLPEDWILFYGLQFWVCAFLYTALLMSSLWFFETLRAELVETIQEGNDP